VAKSYGREGNLKITRRRARVLGIVLLATLSALLATVSAEASPGFPAHYSAPYLQITASDAGDMSADMRATGDRFYSLAFLIPSRSQGCMPVWEDNRDRLGAFVGQVTALQKAGGNVIVSFGGASGGELAITCSTVSKLESAYARVLSTYHVNRLDFDIEGRYLNNRAANARRDRALAKLQHAHPGLRIDYTVPVAPTGMEPNALALLRDAKSKAVKVNLVNIMTMDFGNGQNVLADAKSAARASAAQLGGLYGISTAAAYHRMGLTVIAGKNDDKEVFTRSDGRKLESFAAARGVTELAFWELDHYDKPLGYAYSKIFERITS
jgi:chitinase